MACCFTCLLTLYPIPYTLHLLVMKYVSISPLARRQKCVKALSQVRSYLDLSDVGWAQARGRWPLRLCPGAGPSGAASLLRKRPSRG